ATGGVFNIMVTVPANSITTFHGTATDAAGNVSACSASLYTYVHDDSAAAAPVLTGTSPLSPSSASSPMVTGLGEVGATVRVFASADCSGTPLATGKVDASGGFAILVGVPSNAETTLYAQATDVAGNVSACSDDGLTYVHDSLRPDAPVMTGTDPVSPSNVAAPSVKGTAEAGAAVSVFTTTNCSGGAAGTGTASEAGEFSVQVTVAESSQTTFYATATDLAGNVSLCAVTGVTYVHETTIPDAPALTGTTPASPSNAVTSPKLSGTALAGGTVKVYKTADCTGDAAATAAVGAGGTFEVEVAADANATTTFRATVTSFAGNTSACSEGLDYVHDSTAPAAPVVTGTAPASPSNDATPTVKGTAEAGSSVAVFSNVACTGAPLARGTADAAGAFAIDAAAAANGTTKFYAAATDVAGNISACSSTFATYLHDDVPPAEPTFIGSTPASPSKVVTTPFLTGITDSQTKVEIFATADCSGGVFGTQTSADGSFSIKVTVPANSATKFHAVATDAAGNRSACSSSELEFVHDNAAPAAPVLVSTDPASPSNNANPTVNGTAEPNAEVKLYKAAGCAGTVAAGGSADGTGAFAILTGVAQNATTTLYGKATDVAGNTSDCSAVGLAYVHDSVAPEAIAFTGTNPPSPSNSLTPQVLGTSEAGATVRLYRTTNCSGAEAGNGKAGEDGAFAIGVTVASGSTSTFYGKATDAAGNVSLCSASGQTYSHDTTKPQAPVLTGTTPASPSNSVTTPKVNGTTMATSTVKVFKTADCSGAAEATGTSAANGTFSIQVTVAANAETTLYANVTSGSGNVSACSLGVTYVHDGVAPAAPVVTATDPVGPSNVAAPAVKGTAEAGSSVAVFTNATCSGAAAATGTAGATGDFAVAGAAAAPNATTRFYAKATDLAGNASPCSTTFASYEHDNVAPAAPVFVGSTPASPSQSVTTPFLAGTATTGTTVEVFTTSDCTGAVLGSQAVTGGSFNLMVTVQPNTTTKFRAVAVDAAGNRSTCSASELSYTHDSLPPGSPNLQRTEPASPSSSANPTVSGTAEAGAEVKLYKAAGCTGAAAATGTADGTGAFAMLVGVTTNATTTFYGTAKDAAGNLSGCSATGLPYVHDNVAPATVAFTGTNPPSPSNSLTPQVLGTAEAASTVKLYKTANCTGAVDGTGTADAAGAFAIGVTVASGSTTTWYASATDGAGNTSPCSATSQKYVHDTYVPEAPILTGTTPASPSNSVTTPKVNGTALAGGTVKVFKTADCTGAAAATGTVAADGTFQVQATVTANTTTTFRATVTTTSGNTSACSTSSVKFVHDSVAPAAPSVTGTSPASPSNNPAPSVSGTAEALASVLVYTNASCTGTPAQGGAADAAGAFTLAGVPAAANATTRFHAKATDAAGNAGPCSTTFATYQHDDVPPAQPVFVGTTPQSPSSTVTTPFVAGTAEVGTTLALFPTLDCSGAAAGSAVIGATGTFNIMVTVPANTSTTFRAEAKDTAGNSSGCSASSITYEHDSLAPAAPEIAGTDPATPSNVATPTVLGTTEPGATVRLYKAAGCSGSAAATGEADVTGAFSLLVSVGQNQATSLYARATDHAGNASPCSAAYVFTHDSVAPAAPALTGTNPVSPANKLDPAVLGTTEPGATAKVYKSTNCSGAVAGTATADATGAFSATVTVTAGTTTQFTATATDKAGNTSPCTPTPISYVHDNNLPAAPVLTGTEPVSPSKTSTTPSILGTAVAGGTVKLYKTSTCTGAIAGTGVATTGSFSIPVSVTANTTTVFHGTVTSTSGNTSPCSTGITYVHDSVAPAAPGSLSVNPLSPSNEPLPDLFGTAEAGSTVKVYAAAGCTGAVLGTATAAAGGDFSAVDLAVSRNTTTNLYATATDAAGNASPCTTSPVAYLHDDVAPAVPTLTGTSPVSPSNSITTPIVSGIADNGTTVNLYTTGDCTGLVVGTATVSGGAFSIPVTVSANTTTSFKATATDTAGNTSGCSPALVYVHDDQAPAVPVLSSTTPASPSNVLNPTVRGSGEVNAAISLFTNSGCTGSPVGSTTADGVGQFSLLVAANPNATTTWYRRAKDAAGNWSACSSGIAYLHDNVPPAVPVMTSTVPASPSNTSTTPAVKGTTDPNTPVKLYKVSNCSGTPAATGTSDATGLFTLSAAVTANTTTTFYASASDAAGNTSACAAPGIVYVHDNTTPAAPVLTGTDPDSPSNSDTTPRLIGTAEGSSRVKLYAGASCPACSGTVVAQGDAAAGGGFNLEATVSPNTSTVFCASSTDAAGNVSNCSATRTYVHDNLPPALPTFSGTTPASPSNTSTTPKINGAAEAAATVKLYTTVNCTGGLAGSGPATGGAFAIDVAVGANTTTRFYGTATDAAGNTSSCSTAYQDYTHDTVAPAAPAFTGTSPTSPSNNQDPYVQGTAEASGTVRLYTTSGCTGTVAGTGTATGGTFSIQVHVASSSTTTFKATVTDAAGNTSACSPAGITYVHDLTAPASPVFTGTTPASPSNTSTTPTINGTTIANGTVKLYTTSTCTGTVVATGTASGTGTFSLGVTVGTNTTTTFYGTVTNTQGNTSACSNPGQVYTHDSTAPGAPTVTGSAPVSPSNIATPSVFGTAEANATVKLYGNSGCTGTVLGTGTASGAGAYNVLNVAVTLNATTTVYAKATDAAGNTGACSTTSVSYQHDNVSPVEPTFQGTVPTSPSRTVTTPRIDGLAENGSSVKLYATSDCSGVPAGTATATAIGFSITVTVSANSTTTFRATSTDAAGNTSACSSASITYVHDSTNPAAPSITGSTPPSPSNVQSPALNGTAEPNATVKIYKAAGCSGSLLGSATADGTTGAFTATVTADANTTTSFYGTATDLAGNTGACSTTPFAYVHDNVAPPAPVVTSTPVSPANNNAPTFNLTTEPNAYCEGWPSAGCPASPPWSSGQANGAGSLSLPASGLLDNTTYTFSFKCRDAAQNWSGCTAITYIEDSAAPVIPGVLAATNTTGPGVQLNWSAATDANGPPITYRVCMSTSPSGPPDTCTQEVSLTDTYSHAFGPLSSATRYYFSVRAVDRAGNIGTALRATAKTPGSAVVVRVAQGGNHSCSLLADGTVQCWGRNHYGQLGNGGTADSPSPVVVSGLTNVTAITAGMYHTCALVADGSVRCWGYNALGQLGDGSNAQRNTPVWVGISAVRAIDAGANHTCAILSSGSGKCWGSNAYGQLGDNNEPTDSNVPVSVYTPFWPPVPLLATDISAGDFHTCIARSDGWAKCWGRNNHGQLGNGTTTDSDIPVTVKASASSYFDGALKVGAGRYHSCAATSTGKAWCWGYNNYGQLGGHTGNASEPYPVTVKVRNILGWYDDIAYILDVTLGQNHSCLRRGTGSVYCFGRNSQGQIGNDTTTDYDYAVHVLTLSSVGSRSLSAGDSGNCVARSDGTAWCWGDNQYGQAGDGTSANDRLVPVQVRGISGYANALAIATGSDHTCGLLPDGSVQCWGANGNGQLGNGGTTASIYPIAVSGLTQVTAIAGGDRFNCALLGSGEVYCWGRNDVGQIGTGTAGGSVLTPTNVTSLSAASAIAAGAGHACALVGGGVKCWGYGGRGQLGNGATANSATPVDVRGITTARGISAGYWHTCAVLDDGTVKCWGWNAAGQLGDNTTTNRSTPVTVSGLTTQVAVAAAGDHTCAADLNQANCWGRGNEGEMGDGTTTSRLVPGASVSGLINILGIRAGYRHSCSVQAGSVVRCWGLNADGQLGDGSTTNRSSPVNPAVGNVASVVSQASGYHSCAVQTDGSPWCWGDNSSGQLGDLTTTDRTIPTRVSYFP
ncbi:MAG: fibronectin type III domain-containing protein, partial [Deltaproteobacteria bacterium]|nr:fibronectin type III domain-containing protein [Deltaproteobacteria bacterium]